MKSKISFCDRKMVIPVETGVDVRYYGELMYIIFDKPYCWLHFTENTKYKVEVTLKDMMDNLPKEVFMKCKRSAILNLCYCKVFRKKPPVIVMDDGEKFMLSRQNVQDFRRMTNILPRISPPCHTCYTCRNDKCENRVIFYQKKMAMQNNEPKET